jgi:hypothetical protein
MRNLFKNYSLFLSSHSSLNIYTLICVYIYEIKVYASICKINVFFMLQFKMCNQSLDTFCELEIRNIFTTKKDIHKINM